MRGFNIIRLSYAGADALDVSKKFVLPAAC